MSFFFAALLVFSALPGIAAVALAGCLMCRDGRPSHGIITLSVSLLSLVGTLHLAHILITV